MNHLHPSTRPLLSESPERRIFFVRSERWIKYPAADALLKEMEVLHDRPRVSRMPGLLVVGEANQGKTTIVKKFRAKHPTINDPQAQNIVAPVMLIECPPVADERRLYRAILDEIGAPYTKNAHPDWMHREIKKQLHRAGTRVLVLDEVHNVLVAAPAKQRQFLVVLKFLTNTLQMPIVLVGNDDARNVATNEAAVARRFRVVKLPKWHDRDEFTKLLNSFEKLLPLKHASHLNAESIVSELMALSENILGEVSYLLTEAACAAIESGVEQIMLKGIRAVPFVPPSRRHGANPPSGWMNEEAA